MLTQKKIDKFYSDVNSLDIKKKVSVITRETQFPQSNVSEWLRKVKRPSEAFIDKFYEKFGHMIKQSTNNLQSNLISEAEMVYGKDVQAGYIELKTASGKSISVIAEGQTEIALLNAFLEERDRVLEERNRTIDKIEMQTQARIEELIQEKENLNNILHKYLVDIQANLAEVKEDTSLGLAYQRTWVEYTAEQAADGNKKKKDETVLHMNKLLRSQIDGGHKEDKPIGARKPRKAS